MCIPAFLLVTKFDGRSLFNCREFVPGAQVAIGQGCFGNSSPIRGVPAQNAPEPLLAQIEIIPIVLAPIWFGIALWFTNCEGVPGAFVITGCGGGLLLQWRQF